MKNSNKILMDELDQNEIIAIDGGCEIQDSGKPETIWEKIWDLISW